LDFIGKLPTTGSLSKNWLTKRNINIKVYPNPTPSVLNIVGLTQGKNQVSLYLTVMVQ